MKTTLNTLVTSIATRAMELGNLSLPELRRLHPDCISHADWRNIIDNRGQCIEAILLEEYLVEFDIDINNE